MKLAFTLADKISAVPAATAASYYYAWEAGTS